MGVKEKDLPVSENATVSDFLRMVSSGGASELVSAGFLYSGMITLDTTAAAGTTDGDLYRAIVALGWQNDVIE